MSTQCFSTYTDGANGSVYRCKLPSGHDAWHQNGDWEWWDEGGKLEAEKVIGRPDSPQQTITSLREMRESLAALVTEVRGLRSDLEGTRNQIDGLYEKDKSILGGLDKLMQSHAALEQWIDRKFSGVYGGQDALATAFNRNTGDLGEAIGQLSLKLGALENAFDEYLGKTLEGITTAISASRESAMRNHTQVMDALNRYFAELKHLYGKLNYNIEQELAVGPATRNEGEGSADGNGVNLRSPLAARPKQRRGKRRK